MQVHYNFMIQPCSIWTRHVMMVPTLISSTRMQPSVSDDEVSTVDVQVFDLH